VAVLQLCGGLRARAAFGGLRRACRPGSKRPSVQMTSLVTWCCCLSHCRSARSSAPGAACLNNCALSRRRACTSRRAIAALAHGCRMRRRPARRARACCGALRRVRPAGARDLLYRPRPLGAACLQRRGDEAPPAGRRGIDVARTAGPASRVLRCVYHVHAGAQVQGARALCAVAAWSAGSASAEAACRADLAVPFVHC